MERSIDGDGEVAAKRPNLSSSGVHTGEDILSALPDDILALILLRLDTITEAIKTSVLSRRWCRTWTLLPELTFRSSPEDHHISEVLAPPEAPALRQICVVTRDESHESVATWLPLAAHRLSGALIYCNLSTVLEEEDVHGAIPLPCFGNATALKLNIGFLALALPASGEFTKLTELCLQRVRFRGTCELGEVISSPRCPGLRKLSLRSTLGLASLDVCSHSLLEMELFGIEGLLLLKIDASALTNLTLNKCFVRNQPTVKISAPHLVSLRWADAYDPSSVDFGNLEQLQLLRTYSFLVYGKPGSKLHRHHLQLLQRFQFVHSLDIVLSYTQEMHEFQYLMEDLKVLPNAVFLTMLVVNQGHTFSASSFHVLRLCTGIRRLRMILHTSINLQEQSTCPQSCICHEPTNWKTEELSLNRLTEVEIIRLTGEEHEFAFLKRLFEWAVMLEEVKINFCSGMSKSKAKELCQRLSTISRQETHMQCYIYHNRGKRLVESLSLEDEEGTGCDCVPE